MGTEGLTSRLLGVFNLLLEKRGLPTINWVVAVGKRESRPGGSPKRASEVRWNAQLTARWGFLDVYEPLGYFPIWADPETGKEYDGAKIYEYTSDGTEDRPSEYVVGIAQRRYAGEVKKLLEEFILVYEHVCECENEPLG